MNLTLYILELKVKSKKRSQVYLRVVLELVLGITGEFETFSRPGLPEVGHLIKLRDHNLKLILDILELKSKNKRGLRCI